MLRQPGLALVKRVADLLDAAQDPEPRPFLSLSWQDVACTDAELEALLGPAGLALPARADSKQIVDWHKCPEVTTRIPDWHDLLRLLKFEPTSTDIVQARGCEKYLDLNFPAPPRHREAYACVLDNVAHHCFDVAQALRNIVAMPRLGGYVLHVTPLTMVNHGFYTLGPTLLHDFYAANGYEVVAHVYHHVNRNGAAEEVRPVDPTRRMKDLADNAVQLFLAKRVGVRRPMTVPVQSKFVRHPESTIREGEER